MSPKILYEYLSTLDIEIAEKYKKNCLDCKPKPHVLPTPSNLAAMLARSFSWQDSPEGGPYWHKIFQTLSTKYVKYSTYNEKSEQYRHYR